MVIPIGESGFGYIVEKSGKIINTTIVNIKTNKTIFTLKGGYEWKGRGLGASKKEYSDSKKFLGLDNRYYYITSTPEWGQIQSDGAVLRANRTILTNLAFYPQYKEPVLIPVPVTKLEPISTTIPAMSVTPLMDILPEIPIEKMGDTWINQLMDRINNQIHQIIQSILNLLRPKT